MGFFDDITAIVHEVKTIKDDIVAGVSEPIQSLSETLKDHPQDEQ